MFVGRSRPPLLHVKSANDRALTLFLKSRFLLTIKCHIHNVRDTDPHRRSHKPSRSQRRHTTDRLQLKCNNPLAAGQNYRTFPLRIPTSSAWSSGTDPYEQYTAKLQPWSTSSTTRSSTRATPAYNHRAAQPATPAQSWRESIIIGALRASPSYARSAPTVSSPNVAADGGSALPGSPARIHNLYEHETVL